MLKLGFCREKKKKRRGKEKKREKQREKEMKSSPMVALGLSNRLYLITKQYMKVTKKSL